MDQEQVNFRATIVDDDALMTPMEVLDAPMPPSSTPPVPPTVGPPVSDYCEELPDCCKAIHNKAHPFESFAQQGELAEALPMIFVGIGIAYVVGILTGAAIFSPPSMIEFVA